MARTQAEIENSMDVEQAAQTDLVDLNSTSQTAIYTLWKYIVSLVMALHEQLWDIKKAELEEVVKLAPSGSDSWLRNKVLQFQYSATTPQVVTLDTVTMSVNYATVDTSLQIISRCSVKTLGSQVASIKVATGTPPAALSTPQLTALQNYLTGTGDSTYSGRGLGVGFAGVKYIASSYDSDKFYLKATIYYDGQYISVISDNVITAINTYLSEIPFDGYLKLLTLTDYIQAVAGVSDIKIENCAIRADATAFANTTYLVQNFTEAYSSYPTFAGYAVEENTAGQDFLTNLTFTQA